MLITAYNKQSLIDLAIQACGSFEAAYVLADRNGIGLSDELIPGLELEYAVSDITHQQVVITLAASGSKPATAITPQDTEQVPYGGIGYMRIEIDFIVS